MTPDMAIGIVLGALLALVLIILAYAVVAIVDYDSRERAEQLGSRAVETVEHYESGLWSDEVGCGAECACGVFFDGFDTTAAASAHIEQHIADETGVPA